MLKVCVLILEDDEQEMDIAREMFTDSKPPILEPGESVVFAMSGVEAIDKLSGMAPPTGFILDLNMPGTKNGFDVLKYIREESEFSDAPVIIYSSSPNPGDKDRCMEAGATDYVRKPDDLDLAEAELRRLLDLFRAQAISDGTGDSSLDALLRRVKG